ncbi:MAG: SIS domain-containing protein [Candidatus Ranarchaeia archaeon]
MTPIYNQLYEGRLALKVLNEIGTLLDQIRLNITSLDEEDIHNAVKTIASAKKIYVVGHGRSGLIARLFGIRLHRLGFGVNVVSEDVISMARPLKGTGNVVVAISGSGETEGIVSFAEGAKERGATLIVVTSFPASSLARIADRILVVKGRTKKWEFESFLEREFSGEAEPVTTEGSMFEISSLILLEGIALEISHLKESKIQ